MRINLSYSSNVDRELLGLTHNWSQELRKDATVRRFPGTATPSWDCRLSKSQRCLASRCVLALTWTRLPDGSVSLATQVPSLRLKSVPSPRVLLVIFRLLQSGTA